MMERAVAKYPTVIADVCFAVVITRMPFETQSETKDEQNPMTALRISFAAPLNVSGMIEFSKLLVTNHG